MFWRCFGDVAAMMLLLLLFLFDVHDFSYLPWSHICKIFKWHLAGTFVVAKCWSIPSTIMSESSWKCTEPFFNGFHLGDKKEWKTLSRMNVCLVFNTYVGKLLFSYISFPDLLFPRFLFSRIVIVSLSCLFIIVTFQRFPFW